MGKSRRPHTPGPSQAGSPGRTSGPMDGYVCTPRDMRSAPAASKMAPASPGDSSSDSLTQGSPRGDTLAHISSELAKITANMLSRADKAEMLAEIRTAIREEVMEVRKDLTALEQRVEALEADRAQTVQHQQATDTATTRQGNVLLDLRRQLEDLDNRGRRNNIRIRGLQSTEHAPLETGRSRFTRISPRSR
ncbi:Hypothetical predicted protein [Pelobates cultripes]|uniref:Uncharacterized protein n=1 Tax=Pelobates cultripes TaxID=61616 RepID=A0AAD1TG43_PELCU|nr:Hypothetical predicted protein [Pelobates cultripes]